MLLRCGLLLAALSCVQPKDFHNDGTHHFSSFSSWPSFHNGATMLRFRRAATLTQKAGELAASSTDTQGYNEGNAAEKSSTEHVVQLTTPPGTPSKIENSIPKEPVVSNANPVDSGNKSSTEKSNKSPKETLPEATTITPTFTNSTVKKDNGTNAEQATKQWDLSNPEATKRGLIVFGGFALLAMAYFIFYRTKSKFTDAGNSNSTNESNQFRYGVLQSDDRRDNLELSRVPLTMESDEEEDEDLEIFDLGQKKKSLSYVNLQGTDEDVVLSGRQDSGKDELLLDIDDDSSDILINWSSSKRS